MFFLKNHAQNAMEKLFPDPFLKIRNWGYLWINSKKFHPVCFCCYVQVEDYQIVLKQRANHLLLFHIKLLWKLKEVWNYSPCLIFCMIFVEKYFSGYILSTDQILLWRNKFWNLTYIAFLSRQFPTQPKKSGQFKYLKEEKYFLR